MEIRHGSLGHTKIPCMNENSANKLTRQCASLDTRTVRDEEATLVVKTEEHQMAID